MRAFDLSRQFRLFCVFRFWIEYWNNGADFQFIELIMISIDNEITVFILFTGRGLERKKKSTTTTTSRAQRLLVFQATKSLNIYKSQSESLVRG